MSVGDTLEFAARLRTPQNRGEGIDRETYAKHMASVYMATYGLSHTKILMLVTILSVVFPVVKEKSVNC